MQTYNLSNKDFSDLLETISSTMDERKRKLWLLIYSNSLEDRQRAIEQYDDLASIVVSKSAEHAIHGKTISAFIERMNKANDQLLKLADLIEAASEPTEVPDEKNNTKIDLYDQIANK